MRAAPIRIERSFVAALPEASVTCRVNGKVAAVVGVPDIWAAFRLKPGGNDPPETDQVYGGCPPVAETAWTYELPTTPSGSAEVLIVSVDAGALMTTLQFEVTEDGV